MIGRVWEALRETAKSWAEEAERRRVVFADDPAASALEYAASELRERIRLLEGTTEMLTSVEFGQVHGVCPQTVRGWCARGLLPGAIRAGAEWRIPRSTPAPVNRRLARAS